MDRQQTIALLLLFLLLAYLAYTFLGKKSDEETNREEKESGEEGEAETEQYSLTASIPDSFVAGTKAKVTINAKNMKGAVLSVPTVLDGIGYMFERTAVRVDSDDFQKTVEVVVRERDDVSYPVRGDFVIKAYKNNREIYDFRHKVAVYRSEEEREQYTVSTYVTTFCNAKIENGDLHVTLGATLNPGYPPTIKSIKLIRPHRLAPDDVVEKTVPAYRPPSFTASHTFVEKSLSFPTRCGVLGCSAVPITKIYKIVIDGIDYEEVKKVTVYPDGRIEISDSGDSRGRVLL